MGLYTRRILPAILFKIGKDERGAIVPVFERLEGSNGLRDILSFARHPLARGFGWGRNVSF